MFIVYKTINNRYYIGVHNNSNETYNLTIKLGKKDSEETNAKSKTHGLHLRSLIAKKRRSEGWDPMQNENSRLKISQSKIVLKRLYKDDEVKMTKPVTDKWNKLVSKGFR
jgi:hypothetical protein